MNLQLASESPTGRDISWPRSSGNLHSSEMEVGHVE